MKTDSPPELSKLKSIRAMLDAHDQAHLLRFVDELDAAQQVALIDQIAQIDFDALDSLIEKHVRHVESFELPRDLAPAPYYPADSTDSVRPYDAAMYRNAGVELIRSGCVAAFTVAGGQGTRLGWNGPKGTYPATVVTGKPLFRVFAEQILAAEKNYRVTIPWYIMTSPINDAPTRAFFLDNNHFGLVPQNIFFFPQGVMPSLDAETGRILLASKCELALNPDGHGGSIKALRTSGAIEDMKARGIEHISYFQVDNPLVKAIDPLFIGLHAKAPDSSHAMSTKMVAKTNPNEKVGVLCHADGRTVVVEYSDLPESLAAQRNENGQLRFNAGNIAIHLISVKFVEKLTADARAFGLPYHRALKKVEHFDPDTGRMIEPDEPNAVKLETFVFDAIPLAEKSIVLETERIEEFAPIKNATGVDSTGTSHELQSERAARWLTAHGVTIPRNESGEVAARIEISPLTALEPADLVNVDLPEQIAPGQELAL